MYGYSDGTMTSQDALAFIRVSTGSQDERTQRTNLNAEAPKRGLHIVHEVVLHGYSASKGEQEPAIQEAIAGIRDGRWTVVLVTDSSRLDRREDLDKQVATLLAIREAGGSVVSTDPGESEFGKTGDLTGWIGTLAKQHANAEKSRVVKEMTWRGIQEIIANRAWYGQLPPLWTSEGARYHKRAVCTDPDGVREIYQGVRDGHSLSSLARQFGTYPQSIRNLVRTEANYTGKFQCSYTHDGETTTWEHAVTPVVDRELWFAATKAMGKRGAVMNNTGGRPVAMATNWLSGLLECPVCGGHLYKSRNTLRCGGKGKDRRACREVKGLNLAMIQDQVEGIVANPDVMVYRYQRISGNAGELAELNRKLDRLNATPIVTIPRDQRAGHLDKIAELEDQVAAFELVPDTYAMTETGETLADLWHSGDKRQIVKALQRYIAFHVAWDQRVREQFGEVVWIEGYYPGETLIEITGDLMVKMAVPASGRSPASAT